MKHIEDDGQSKDVRDELAPNSLDFLDFNPLSDMRIVLSRQCLGASGLRQILRKGAIMLVLGMLLDLPASSGLIRRVLIF